MDYEQYFTEAQVFLRDIKEKTAAQAKAAKKIEKCITDGDIGALPKLFSSLRDAARLREEALDRLDALTAGFDGREYFSSGDFALQMIESCHQFGVDVQGSYPVYDMFPCRVTINADTQDVTVDRKKLPYMRPSKLVGSIKKELEKLEKVNFNAQQFAKELAAAYDLAIIKASRKKPLPDDAPMYALELYNTLTPMQRYKKEYTKNNFAYDLARLYSEEDITLGDGRSLRFDTVRDTAKTIRILDRNGSEQFITTIRFMK